MIYKCIAKDQKKLSFVLRNDMDMSSALINKYKYLEAFTVNKEVQRTDYIVKPGDVIEANITEEYPNFPPQDGPIDIIYEDDALLVLDKPIGMPVHPTHARIDGSLSNLVLSYYMKKNLVTSIHVMTRLDRDTKGIVIIAKDTYIASIISENIKNKNVEKIYHALVLGGPKDNEGVIDLPIDRIEEMNLKRAVMDSGKRAITEYKVIKRNTDTTLLELKAITGRTHQLRVHCSHLGFPIVGDPLYGGGQGGQRLVAKKIIMPHPLTKEKMIFESHIEV